MTATKPAIEVAGLTKSYGDNTVLGGVDLAVRYDDGLARQLGLNEGVLKLWRYSDNEWIRMDHDSTFERDPAHHILSVHAPPDFTYFAVSAPEPGAVALIIVVGGTLLLRRRRG